MINTCSNKCAGLIIAALFVVAITLGTPFLAQAQNIAQVGHAINAAAFPPGLMLYGKPVISADAESIILFVLNELEGSGYVANDNGHGPSRYGIVGKFNGLTPHEVRNLTAHQATIIYKRNYWDPIEADNLSPHMRLLAFNAAVQFGIDPARLMIAEANGSPYKLHQAAWRMYVHLINKNAARYSRSMPAWTQRQRYLAYYLGGKDAEMPITQPAAPPTSHADKIAQSDIIVATGEENVAMPAMAQNGTQNETMEAIEAAPTPARGSSFDIILFGAFASMALFALGYLSGRGFQWQPYAAKAINGIRPLIRQWEAKNMDFKKPIMGMHRPVALYVHPTIQFKRSKTAFKRRPVFASAA